MGPIYDNLPFTLLGIALLVNLGFLLVGLVMSASAKDPISQKKSRKVLVEAGLMFGSIILIVLVFFSVTWFLDQNLESQIAVDPEAHPYSPIDPNIPPRPQVFNISGVWFNGPYHFNVAYSLNRAMIYSIVCRNEESYDIIDIEITRQGENLTAHKDYQCWLDSCPDFANLYVGLSLLPININSAQFRAATDMTEKIQARNAPLCETAVEEERNL